jgi:regulatory protein
MIITAIKNQIKQSDRYSIFVDGKYGFSLSATALLDSGLVRGQDLTSEQLKGYKQVSNDDKVYNLVLRYASLRSHSKWEIESYLIKKKVSPALFSDILNKLTNIGIINDDNFAAAFVRDRKLLRPTSRRKLILELKQKRVKDESIQKAIAQLNSKDESQSLTEIIRIKRQQSRYKDNLKLMQYLSRQGFGYGDIKQAMQEDD